MTRTRFVVVGGGASGTLLAAQLLRQARRPVEVVLVEPNAVGRGVAYGTPHREHLLNVPSGGMSALPEEPDHFVRWLGEAGEPSDPSGFAPRPVYGAYLESTLHEAALRSEGGAELRVLRERATAVRPCHGGARVELRSGSALHARRVALALGNLPGPGPLAPAPAHPRYLADPWRPGSLEQIPYGDRVLVLGTGLTMVDVALVLHARGHEAPILAVSRRGLLPRQHLSPAAAPRALAPPPGAPGLRGWVRWTRHGEETVPRGDWRTAVDALRPVTPEAWAGLDVPQRRRFLRHVRPYWDVHRHRMAPSVAAEVEDLLATGRLRVMAARIHEVRADGCGLDLDVVLRPRGTGAPAAVRTDWIVDATGPEPDPARACSPLLRQLLGDGHARPDELRLGLDATATGALLDASGVPSPALFTLGPLLRGRQWETTAVPEIRSQARDLAAAWLAAGT